MARSKPPWPRLSSIARIEVQDTGTVGVARHAQILRIANVRSEFDLVIALDAGPVVDNLELVFLLCQRAVAPADVKTVAECSIVIALIYTVSVEKEGRKSGRIGCTEV